MYNKQLPRSAHYSFFQRIISPFFSPTCRQGYRWFDNATVAFSLALNNCRLLLLLYLLLLLLLLYLLPLLPLLRVLQSSSLLRLLPLTTGFDTNKWPLA